KSNGVEQRGEEHAMGLDAINKDSYPFHLFLLRGTRDEVVCPNSLPVPTYANRGEKLEEETGEIRVARARAAAMLPPGVGRDSRTRPARRAVPKSRGHSARRNNAVRPPGPAVALLPPAGSAPARE